MSSGITSKETEIFTHFCSAMFLYSDYQALETRMCTASAEKGGYITSIFINLEVFNDRVTPIKFF